MFQHTPTEHYWKSSTFYHHFILNLPTTSHSFSINSPPLPTLIFMPGWFSYLSHLLCWFYSFSVGGWVLFQFFDVSFYIFSSEIPNYFCRSSKPTNPDTYWTASLGCLTDISNIHVENLTHYLQPSQHPSLQHTLLCLFLLSQTYLTWCGLHVFCCCCFLTKIDKYMRGFLF